MSDLSFTCPRCDTATSNPHEIREGFCGVCRAFTGAMPRDYDRITAVLQIATQRIDPRLTAAHTREGS